MSHRGLGQYVAPPLHTSDGDAEVKALALQQASEPALWILKLVQAAVSSGAAEVNIKLSKRHYKVRFRPGSHWRGWSDIPEVAQQHLRLAITLAHTSSPQRLKMQWPGRLSSPVRQAEADVELSLVKDTGRVASIFDPEAKRIAATLGRHCSLCPIPVFLNGRVVNQADPNFLHRLAAGGISTRSSLRYLWLGEAVWFRRQGGFFSLKPPILRPSFLSIAGQAQQECRSGYPARSCYQWLELEGDCACYESFDAGANWNEPKKSASQQSDGIAMIPFDVGLPRRYPQYACRGWRASSRHLADWRLPYSWPQLPALACRRWLGLSSLDKVPGCLFYVVDGVLSNAYPWPNRYGGVAVIADTQVATDLSQLSLLEGEHIRADCDWLEQEAAILAERCKPAILDSQLGKRMRIPSEMLRFWRERTGF